MSFGNYREELPYVLKIIISFKNNKTNPEYTTIQTQTPKLINSLRSCESVNINVIFKKSQYHRHYQFPTTQNLNKVPRSDNNLT